MPTPNSLQLFYRMQQEMVFASNVSRQAIAQKLIDYYDGNQLLELETVLKAQFEDPSSLRMQKAMDNITRFVADETSRVFDLPPTLTCDNPNGQALLDELTSDGVFALVLKVGEVYANLTGIVGLHAWFDIKKQKIKTTIIPSSALFVAQRQEDPTEEEAVVYSREIVDTITERTLVQYVHWDEESCFLFDGVDIGVYKPPSADNQEMLNPYGIIPFAWLRDSLPVGTFFTKADEGLLNAQDSLNILLTSMNQLAKYQGFSQPVMIGTFDPKNPIVIDPSRPIKIPSGQDGQTNDFKFVTPPSKIQDLMAMMQDLIERTVTRRGISATSLKDSSQASSGYALKIMNSRLERKRTDSIPLARSALQRWWEIVKRIYNTHFSVNQIPLDAELNVDFAEPEYEDNPKDLLDMDQKEIELGLSSAVQVIMRDNPDLDEAQAQAIYEKNLSYHQQIKKTFGLADILTAAKAQQPVTPGA